MVEVLRTVAIGPPEFGVGNMEFGVGGWIEGDLGGGVGRDGEGLADDDLTSLSRDCSNQDAFERFVGFVDEGGFEGEVSFRVIIGEVGGDEGILDEYVAGGVKGDRLIDAGVAVTDGGQPVPSRWWRGRSGRRSRCRRRSCRCRSTDYAQWVCRGAAAGATSTASTAVVPGLTKAEISRSVRMKAPRVVPARWPLTHISDE